MEYSDAELAAMMADIESDLVERKESFGGNAPRTAREAVCAFANDLPAHGKAGVLFVGVEDGGRPTGLQITDELLLQLSDIRSDGNILPPPTLTVEKRTLAGADVAVVTVQPADAPPVRYRGAIRIRVGPRRGIATAQDERILNEKRRAQDRTFDAAAVPNATVADLDLRRFEEDYLPQAVDPETLARNGRTTTERLAATKMVSSADDPRPTFAGILTLGKNPQDALPGAYIQFLRVEGRELSDPVVDAARYDGTVLQALRQLDEKLAAHNRTSVDITSGPLETRVSTYPLPALRQLTRNAVMHRTYEATNAPVRVHWFEDRIEITSPGGPYGLVNSANFGQAQAVDYRNPILAEAMRVLGLVQRFGAGIPIARTELRANGNPDPEFCVETNWVHCIVTGRS